MRRILERLRSAEGDERFCVFSREDLEKVHRASLEVLRDVGCQILFDIECLKVFEKMLQPIEVTDESLCLDLIKQIGIGGNYLAEEHTARHFREVLWFPQLMKRISCEAYNRDRSTALRSANERVRSILEKNDPHPLAREQESEIAKIVKATDERYAR